MNRLLKALASPFVVGLSSTLVFAFLSMQFYVERDPLPEDVYRSSSITSILERIDQIIFDFRLKQRGHESTEDTDVALLVIDDRSLKTVGRWPWPREVLAKAIDNAYKYGAKVIAADMVFGEPTHRKELKLLDDLKSKGIIHTNSQDRLNQELKRLDSDTILKEVIEKHSSQFVLGTAYFGYSMSFDSPPFAYLSKCYNMIFESSHAFSIWDQEDVFLVDNDPTDTFLPEMISEVYRGELNTIKENILSAANLKGADSHDIFDLRQKVSIAQQDFCRDFLNPESDQLYNTLSEVWPMIVEQDDSLTKYASFDEWANTFKSNTLQKGVPLTLSWDLNTDLISSGGSNSGFFAALLDFDGTIRKAPLIVRSGSKYFPSISLKAFLLANNYNATITFTDSWTHPGRRSVDKLIVTSLEDGSEVFTIPVNEKGHLFINYAGKQKSYPHVSMGDLLDESSDTMKVGVRSYKADSKSFEEETIEVKKSEFMKDKIFVLGATALGIYDLRVTPFEENYPGAETHANVIGNLQTKNFLKRYREEEKWMMLSIVILGLFLSFLLTKLGALSGLVTTVGFILTTALIDKYLIFGKGYVVSILFPILEFLFIYISMTFYKYFTEEKNKKELRSTFSKYVSPSIVDEILSDPSNIELGGRKERITVFFSDVRGFTTISEKLDPRDLSDLLNSYLTPMTDLVFKNQGTLDKYMGDAVMAFFGAPIHYANHAEQACRCALESLDKLKELQEGYRKKGLPELDIGIGLNTGDCSVGNMGSETVRSYTVMGDAVNLGSRLEGINKQYGTRIIISEFTYEEVKDKFVCREVDWVRVKGKILPVKIYELVAEKQIEASRKSLIEKYKEGYTLYRERSFEQASKVFHEALNIDAQDVVTKLYIDRCAEYISSPPPEDWDGVFVMNTK